MVLKCWHVIELFQAIFGTGDFLQAVTTTANVGFVRAATNQVRNGSAMVTMATDKQGRSQNLRHFFPGMELKLGVVGCSRNQNNCGTPGAYVTCIYCSLSVNINMHKTQDSS